MRIPLISGLRRKRAPGFPRSLGRMKTHDIAITFRMRAGFAGSINRAHPVYVEPTLNDVTNPVAFYGEAVLLNAAANSVRGIIATDTVNGAIYGVAARPFPVQQSTDTVGFGTATVGGLLAPPSGEIDVVREGYAMVLINGAATKGGTVYVWSAATAAPHTQGGFETVNPAGNGFQVTNALFNGPADTFGIGELVLRLQP